MELTIQTRKNDNEIVRIETATITGVIILTVSEYDDASRVFLTPLEAETLAEVLLKMAAKLEAPEQILTGDDRELGVIEAPVGQEKNVTEQIAKIWRTQTGSARIETQSGMVILASKDVWEKEGNHLQNECDREAHSLMYVRKNAEDINWHLVDCLPF